MADGKNDGSVGDHKYFECEPNHGLFIKRAQVRLEREAVALPVTSNLTTAFGVGATSATEKLAALRKKRESASTTASKSSSLLTLEDEPQPPPPAVVQETIADVSGYRQSCPAVDTRADDDTVQLHLELTNFR